MGEKYSQSLRLRKLCELLSQISDELDSDGKTDTATFFRERRQFFLAHSKETHELREALTFLSRSAPLAQYASFSQKQFILFSKILDLCLEILDRGVEQHEVGTR